MTNRRDEEEEVRADELVLADLRPIGGPLVLDKIGNGSDLFVERLKETMEDIDATN